MSARETIRDGLRPTCACGSGTAYDGCCGRLHRGAAEAASPEELMRARYAAYAVGGPVGEGYVFRTWHPRTRPADVATDPALHWTGLQVLDAPAPAAAGDGPDDAGEAGEAGEVEFRATYELHGATYALHERSRFVRRAGRWVYVEPLDRPDATTSSTRS